MNWSPRFLKRTLLATGVVAVVFTGVMGFAHTRAGRPLLAVIGPALGMGHAKSGGRCPFGFDVAATPEQKEAGRRQFAALHRGVTQAAAKPALGFVLDQTTRGEVLAWAKAHGVRCTSPKSGADLDCSDVPGASFPAALQGPPVASLWLNFGARDKLTAVIAMRRDKSAQAIGSEFNALEAQVNKEEGATGTVVGDPSPAGLAAGLLRQASVEYRFRDYYAIARATNMGEAFLLTEEYRSLPN